MLKYRLGITADCGFLSDEINNKNVCKFESHHFRSTRRTQIVFFTPLFIGIISSQGCEGSTWVIHDFTSSTPGELSVSRGQQVEILEQRSNGPTAVASSDNMVLVRVTPPTLAAAVPVTSSEGLVPVSCIKFPPVTTRCRRADTISGEAGNGKRLRQIQT